MESTIIIADGKHDSACRKCKHIGCLLKFSETLLFSCLDIPYPQNAVIADGYKLLSDRMSDETPEFTLEVRSHQN